jgi:hypothetical protein
MSEPHQDADFVLRRFRRLLRRAWWVVPLAGAVCAVAGIVGLPRHYTSTVTLEAAAEEGVLSSAKLEVPMPPLNVDVAAISSDRFENEVGDRIGSSVNATVLAAGNVVTITVESSSQKAVSEAVAAYVEGFTESRRTTMAQELDKVAANLDFAQQENLKRIADIDAELASVTDSTGSLAQALLYDRSVAATENVTLSRQIDAVEVVQQDSTAGVSVADSNEAKASGVTVSRIIPGVSLGIILAIGLLYLLAVLDHKVRSRADLAGLTGLDVLGVLPNRGADDLDQRVVALISAQAAGRGASAALLVPIDAAAQRSDALARLVSAAGDGLDLRLADNIGGDRSVLASDVPLVLVAAAGATTAEAVEHAASDLALAGRTVLGSLLVDVAPSDMRHAVGSDRRRSRLY